MWIKRCTLLAFFLVTFGTTTAQILNPSGFGPEQSNQSNPITDILNPDGSINTVSQQPGSFDVTGYEMRLDSNGAPIFVEKSAVKAPGDENWSGLFSGPEGADSPVYAVAADDFGNVYIGGSFLSVAGVKANHIAKWDGAQWSALGDGSLNNVYCMAIDAAGNLFASGTFFTSSPLGFFSVAKWNGTSWIGYGNNFHGSVYCILFQGFDIYIGGSFMTTSFDFYGVAKWNGTGWAEVGTGPDKNVYSLAMDGSGNLYAGGFFTTAGGATINSIAKWDGVSWSSVGSGTIGKINSIVFDENDNLFVAGSFGSIGGITAYNIAKWNGSVWAALQSSGTNNECRKLIFDINGDLLVGGFFTTIDGVAANGIARWNGSTWSPVGNGFVYIYDIAVNYDGVIYSGGDFHEVRTTKFNNVAQYNGSEWTAFNQINAFSVNSYVRSIVCDNTGKVYVAGNFTTAGGYTGAMANPMYIVQWNGSTWSRLGKGLSASANCMTVDNSNNLYIGGDFTTAGVITANKIVKWDGTTWAALGSGMNFSVYSVAVDASGNVYAGGMFSMAGGVPVNSVAKWNGTAWSAMGDGLNNKVRALAVDHNGVVYAGGDFTMSGSNPVSHIAKWDGTTWSQLGDGISGTVHAIAIDGNGNVFAGGDFNYSGDVYIPYVSKWDGATWDTLGSGLGHVCYSLSIDDDNNLFAGGSFGSAGGNNVSRIAKWNGTEWLPLGSGTNNTVLAIDCSGNKVYAGGAFSFAGGKNSAFFGIYSDLVPELNVTGNLQPITNGDITPSLSDHTDFGSTNTGVPAIRTFTVNNTGDGALYLTSISIYGSAFSLISASCDTIAAAGSADIQVQFNANSCGIFNGIVKILNNDPAKTPFEFSISATAIDNIPPIAPVLSTMYAECSATPVVPSTTDACTGTVTGTTTTTFPISAQGITTVLWSFTDGNGNVATAEQNVVIEDITAPVVPVLADVTGECSVTPSGPTTTDACAGTITGTTTTVFPIETQGTTIVSWMFDDGNGNTSEVNQNIIVDDVTNPQLPVLPDITGECEATATYPVTNDNCAGILTGSTTDSLHYSTQGTHTIHWTFDDGNGNSVTASQNVIVDDVTAPQVPTLTDLTDECSVTPSVPVATDACAGSITGTTSTVFPITDQGSSTVIWSFDDGNGNISTATQNVIVDDITNPELPALPDLTGECSLTPIPPVANDLCAGSITATTNSVFPVTAQGTTVVIWLFDDGNGNIVSANQNVLINDTTNPETPVLTDVTGQCSATAVPPQTTDNCTGTIVGTTTDSLTYNTPGNYPIHWTFDDGNGNSILIDQMVIVSDTIAPTVVCAPDDTVEISSPVFNYTVTGTEYDLLNYNDNCGVESVVNDFNGQSTLAAAVLPQGDNTIQWTLTSNNGETVQCSVSVLVLSTDNIEENVEYSMIIYPNPTSGFTVISSPNESEVINGIILIKDVSGKMVASMKINEMPCNINLTDLAPGLYLAEIHSEKAVIFGKIIKQ